MKVQRQRVCVIIPAYNEVTTVGSVIQGLFREFHKTAYTLEVVVVDDGSKDDTARVARKHGAHIISHILNTGAGGATATGLSYADQAGFDMAATMDADGQHKAKDVKKGFDYLLKHSSDLLIGSRLMDNRGMSKVKILGNRGLSFITYSLFGVNVTDSQSGLRIYSKKALESLRWRTNGYEFCSEMLWRAKQMGLKIDEYPIQAIYTEYSESKGQNNWNGFNIVKSLIRRRLSELLS